MLKKTVIAGIAIAATMTAGAGVATAARVYIGGGQWDYGTTSEWVYSDYYHADVCHSSSVDGEYIDQSGPTKANVVARAKAPESIWVDQSYWSNTDTCN